MILSCVNRYDIKNKVSIQDKKKMYKKELEYNNESYVKDISFKYKKDDD